MIIFLNILLLLSPFNLDSLDSIVQSLHAWCMHHVQENTLNHTDIYSALLCGKRLETSPTRMIFTQVGMIHFMVVSGAHLMFLEKLWNKLPPWPFKNIMIFLSLLIYSLMAGLNPPVLRALVSFLIHRLSQKLQLSWTPYWRVMVSGLITLMLKPQWVTSTSLQLSWIGSLGFVSARYSQLVSSFICYILILPIISQWTVLHPLSVGMNFILFPLLSVTLFPLSVFSFIFPPLFPVTSFFWSLLIQILNFIQPIFKSPFYIPPLFGFNIWIYICIIFLGFQTLWIFIRRN